MRHAQIIRGLFCMFIGLSCQSPKTDADGSRLVEATNSELNRSTEMSENEAVRLAQITKECALLTPERGGEFRDYLDRLVAKKDFAALTAIYQSDFCFSYWAAQHMAEALPPDKVVEFAMQFPLGSPNWASSIDGMRCQPKQVVVSYLLACVKDKNPDVRFHCYKMCMEKKWPELLEYAKNDINNLSPTPVSNKADYEGVLGQVARNYIELVGTPIGEK